MVTNTAASEVVGGSGGGGGGGCCEDICGGLPSSSISYLVLSLGFALILVGALFYYVRQRVEVLETSQKEQIHVMQSFIASIGDQFQRMNTYIQQKLGSSGGATTTNATGQYDHANSGNDGSGGVNVKKNLIDISEESESGSGSGSESGSETDSDEYDSDSGSDSSRSSNTTHDGGETGRYTETKQIRIHDPHMHGTNAAYESTHMCTDDDIKVVEITDQAVNFDELDASESSSASSASSSDSESDTEHGTDRKRESRYDEIDVDIHDVSVHVTKAAAGEAGHNDSTGSPQKNTRNTVVLDIGDIDPANVSISGGVGSGADNDAAQYSSLSIKQLRQLLKKKSPSTDVDVSKLKREQIVELLRK